MDQDLPEQLPARRGFSLFYRGRTLLSRIDPPGQAERFVENLTVKDRTLYLCPSPLYGYGILLLLNRLKADSAVLCIEADHYLYELSKNSMKSLLNEEKDRLILAQSGAGPESVAELCALVHKTWGERTFRRVETIRLNGGWQLFPEIYEKAAVSLQKNIAVSWGNAMTLIRLGRLYIRNAVKNTALLPRTDRISSLNFGEDPMLVLGAGPSIDTLLDEAAIKNGKTIDTRPFRIICADTCLPALKERGIEPDLVVILESQHWNLQDFLNVRKWKIPAAVDLSCLPASTRVLGGKIFMFMIPWTELQFFSRLKKTGLLPPALSPLGSVGLTAVELALKIGRGPVVVGGMDFSFTLDAYHARGTPGHLARLSRINRFASVLNAEAAFREGAFAARSKTGMPVRSDPALRNYRNFFETEFADSDRVYEIKNSGLPLGVSELSVKEAAALLLGNAEEKKKTPNTAPEAPPQTNEALFHFIQAEKEYLLKLRDILTGKAASSPEENENLLDTLDYLWAHFPECAAAGGRRPRSTDLSFLKRVRAEIDPFLKLWDMALKEAAH